MIVRVVLALACVAVPAWVLGTRWSAVVDGHPAYLVLLVALAVAGLVTGLRARRTRPAGRLRFAGRAATAVVVVLVLAATAWLRPFPATAVPVSGSVEIVGTTTTWELRPERAPAAVGLVFYPGARVDPRAYLALLHPIAAAGHLVVVVKPPLDIAFLAGGPGPVFDDRPDIVRWVVGGHSLGGTAAASSTDDPRVAGLVLWASYPAGDLSASGLPVLSVSGDRDGLATPADIAAARPLLPPTTEYVVIEGGVHAFFGDYGPQPGDGVPGVDRAVAQRQIVDATVGFVGAR